MKLILRSIRKIILRLFTVVLILLVLAGGYYGIRGYQMYRAAIKDTPVSAMADTIRAKEHFTSYEELPPIYIDAVISAEDKRFFSHPGIDPLAIGRAVYSDITSLSLAEGGSTITQQIAKNLLFTQEKRVERKFAEIFAAFALERAYTKEELFELYVNTIYFGSGYYGIYDASQGYFDKTPADLSDYEAVMLAGIPNAPSNYSPDASMELARKRMSSVLEKMKNCGRLTEKQADHIWAEAP